MVKPLAVLAAAAVTATVAIVALRPVAEEPRRALWTDISPEDFQAGSFDGTEVTSAGGGRGFVVLRQDWSEWRAVVPGERLDIPVGRFVQLRFDMRAGSDGKRAPAIEEATIRLGKGPGNILPGRVSFSAADGLTSEDPDKPCFVEDGKVYPAVRGGFARRNGGLLEGCGPTGRYYDDDKLDDRAWEDLTFTRYIGQREDRLLSFSHGTAPPFPGVGGTYWSAWWEGDLYLPEAGSLLLHVNWADDWYRLKFRGRLISAQWCKEVMNPLQPVTVQAPAGFLPLRLEYANRPGVNADLSIKGSLNGKPFEFGPLFFSSGSFLSPTIDLGTDAAVLRRLDLKSTVPEGCGLTVYIRIPDAGPAAEGGYVSAVKGGTLPPSALESVPFIERNDDSPRGSRMVFDLRQGDDGLSWDEWREYGNGERLPYLKNYQQYRVRMVRAGDGASPRTGGVGISLKPLIRGLVLPAREFDPGGDNRDTPLGRLEWAIDLSLPSLADLEIRDRYGRLVCTPYSSRPLRPGLQKLRFDGLVDLAPLPPGDYRYRLTVAQRDKPLPRAVREGSFKVTYHMGNCGCRVERH